MKRIYVILIVVIAVMTFAALFVTTVYISSSGSYCYAESYEFETNEYQLIKIIERLKKIDSQYIVPSVYIEGQKVEKGLLDGRKDSNDYWYHIYFYYSDKNQIVYFWTRPSSKDKTELALVAINNGLNLGHWKDVNKDYGRSENKKIKREFQERILDKVGIKYEDKGNGMRLGPIQF